MTDAQDAIRERLSRLSGSARRLLDYAVVLEGGARYEVLRHIARVSEEDMIENLREVVEAGILAAQEGRPNYYDFTNDEWREVVLADAGEQRLPKLRAKAEGARRRVEGRDR